MKRSPRSAKARRPRHRTRRGAGRKGKPLSARLVALHSAAAKLAADTSVEKICDDTLDAMKHALGFDHADFTMVDRGWLRTKGYRGIDSGLPAMKLDGPGVIVKAAKRRKAIRLQDVTKEPAYVEGWKGARSELAVPVLVRGRTAGVLNVESARSNAFSKDDQELLETLAAHVSSSLGRLREEKSLRLSETRMRGILSALPDLVFEYDSKGVYTGYYASDKNELAVPPERFLGKKMRDVLPPRVANLIQNAMETIRKTGRVVTIEYRLPTSTGAIRDWETHISRTSNGGYIALARNITRRKKAEERLRLSEERYHSLIDGMLDGTYRTTHKGKVVDVNPAFVKMFGYSNRQELLDLPNIGRALYYSPEDRKSHFLDTGLEKVEVFRMRRKDGSEVWVEDHGRYVHDEKGNVIFHEGVLRDVTERVQAEDAVRESEKRYRDLVELSPDAVAVHDGKKLLYINPAAAEIMGIDDPAKVVGMEMERFVHPDSKPFVTSRVKEMLDEKKPVPLAEEKFMKLDGTPVDVEVAGIPVTWHGTPAVQVVFHDITQRKVMANELKRYSDHLEELVTARTEALREAERMAAMGQFAAMVAHDLRNPLTGITGASYYLRKKFGPTADERTKDMLDVIEKDVTYSNQMMTSLVEYSGEMKLSLVENDLHTIVGKALELVRIPEEVTVSDRTKAQPRAMLDEEKMVRASVNIIQNAVEAMPKGGKLTVVSEESDGNLVLSFSDTGVGMKEEALSRIWVPFSTTKAKGMGLGLPMAKQIVEAHGGSISIESAVGEGTTVTVVLPIRANSNGGGTK